MYIYNTLASKELLTLKLLPLIKNGYSSLRVYYLFVTRPNSSISGQLNDTVLINVIKVLGYV